MRISSKGRYAIASLILMAQNPKEQLNIALIAQELGISKIYLEQVFSQLKKANIVNSIKGAQGGYLLSRDPKNISAHDILMPIEASLFEKTESSVSEQSGEIEQTMSNLLWERLDATITETLKTISLKSLAENAIDLKGNSLMFYI